MEDKTLIAICALLVLGVLECVAMSQGIDGQLLIVVLVIIAGMVGVPIGQRFTKA